MKQEVVKEEKFKSTKSSLELNFKDNPKEMFRNIKKKLFTSARLHLAKWKALVYFAISLLKARTVLGLDFIPIMKRMIKLLIKNAVQNKCHRICDQKRRHFEQHHRAKVCIALILCHVYSKSHAKLIKR